MIGFVGYMHRAGEVDPMADMFIEPGEAPNPEHLIETSSVASIHYGRIVRVISRSMLGDGDRAMLLKEYM